LEREKCDAGVHEGTDAALQGSEEVAQRMRLQGERTFKTFGKKNNKF
jgi:hypothetical protein